MQFYLKISQFSDGGTYRAVRKNIFGDEYVWNLRVDVFAHVVFPLQITEKCEVVKPAKANQL